MTPFHAPTPSHTGRCAPFALIVLLGLAQSLTAQSTWPSFRNGGTGMTTASNLPTRWSPEAGIAWQADIPGYGQSSPVVWNHSIFLTSSEGAFQETGLVHCFDLESGTKKWTTQINSTTKVENYFRNSRAAPSCVVDSNIVISFFPSGDVTAMNHEGRVLWTTSLFKQFGSPSNERGTASSLAQTDKLVFAVVDHEGPSYIVGLDKSTGEIAWKTNRGNRVPSWSSPVTARHLDRELIVVSSADTVDTYDARTGKLEWRIDGIKGNHIPSASVSGDSIYVGSTQMWHGKLDPDQVAASNCRIDLSSKDGKLSYQVKWGAQQANSYYSSPLSFAGFVYYVNKSGVLFCIDQQTGERHYAKRIGNPCWASAVGVQTRSGEKFVFFPTKKGTTVVIRPGKKFDQVARNRLWDVVDMKKYADAAAAQRKKNAVPAEQSAPKTGPEKFLAEMPEKSLHKMFSYGDPIVYAAIVANDRILMRTGQQLFCIDGKQ